MESRLSEIEGTWEEIAAHADELVGRRVRLVVLPDKSADQSGEGEFSTANSLVKYAGTWVGDDLGELLHEVHATRSPAKY
jgi:hypothetical protein